MSRSRALTLDGVAGGGSCAAVLFVHLQWKANSAVRRACSGCAWSAQNAVARRPSRLFGRTPGETRLPTSRTMRCTQKPCGGAIGVLHRRACWRCPKVRFPPPASAWSVVHLLTCAATWKVQRWDARLPARRAAAALAKPGDPSQTAILGAGTLEHERGPCRGAFRPGEMPGDDVPVCDR